MYTYFSSESVTEGHPDKVCDAIADTILDSILENDPNARVACEVACTTGLVLVFGEISTDCYVDISRVARDKIKQIGYNNAAYGFDGDTCAILSAIDEQSADIALGVNQSLESKQKRTADYDIGAGDQGMVCGYASDETDTFMPLSITLAHNLTRTLAAYRKNGTLSYLRPDGKAQVTMEYGDDGRPKRVDAVVISSQHNPDVTQEQIRTDLIAMAQSVIPAQLRDDDTRYYINPTGSFVIGGPHGDSGLTGRKLIVDSYGGYARHGGGAYSGKDPTKVDRSGSYAARQIAKSLVAAGLCKRVELQVSYIIGVAHPVSVCIDTFGTHTVPMERIYELVNERFDLRPAAIIERLGLRRPIYAPTASYGHFGRTDVALPWEEIVQL